MIPTIAWRDGAVRILDQTRLPQSETFLDLRDVGALAEAIAQLRVRGAPAIGIAGAYGIALAAAHGDDAQVAAAAARLRAVRPTAHNLAWAVDQVWDVYRRSRAQGNDPGRAAAATLHAARALHERDLEMSRAMGRAGAERVPAGARILTHCNAGALATGGLGTALAVVFEAAAQGKAPQVFVDETRPLLQGARLTSWELLRAGICATLIVDGAAAWLMAARGVDLVLVGADRIAANGDTANKVGTYAAALAAARHGVPFYVVAPSSTFDRSLRDAREIEIEERAPEEVRGFRDAPVAPAEIAVWNPAFDVTPAALVSGWITERGLLRPPFAELGS